MDQGGWRSKLPLALRIMPKANLAMSCTLKLKQKARRLDKEEVFGTVEAVKTVSDLFMPVSGEVVAVNDNLQMHQIQ